jgi:aryl carrier-like protein
LLKILRASSLHSANSLAVGSNNGLFSVRATELLGNFTSIGLELKSVNLVSAPDVYLGDPFVGLAFVAEIVASHASLFRGFLVLSAIGRLKDALELVDELIAPSLDSDQTIVLANEFKRLSSSSSADVSPTIFTFFMGEVMSHNFSFFEHFFLIIKHLASICIYSITSNLSKANSSE